jgi:glycosyltransferase involved in cell wall biosynthesis
MDLMTALAGRGHEAILLSPDPHDVPPSWGGRGMPRAVRFRTLGSKRGIASPIGVRQVRAVLTGADVLHIHELWDPLNFQLSMIARRLGVAYCISPRGSLDDWAMAQKRLKKQTYFAMFARRMLEGAAIIHYTASAEAGESSRRFRARAHVVIPNLLDMSGFRELPGPEPAAAELGIGIDRPVVVYMGRLHPGKGIEHLISAMPLVLAREPRALLAIAGKRGSPYAGGLERLAESLGVRDSVRFVGFKRGREKLSLLELAAAFALPSSHENFGNALFDAAACGCPLLLTRNVATWRELEEAGVGRAVPQDPSEIAAALLPLIALPSAQRLEAKARIRSWTLGFFGSEHLISQYEDAYRRHGAATKA